MALRHGAIWCAMVAQEGGLPFRQDIPPINRLQHATSLIPHSVPQRDNRLASGRSLACTAVAEGMEPWAGRRDTYGLPS